jgi:hypothetical protein
MAVVNVKSNTLINLDASPIVAQAAGEGGPGPEKINDGVFSGPNAPAAAASIASTFQFIRVPSNCKIKKIWFESAAQAAGTINLGLTYATDGSVNSTSPPTVVGAGGATLFGSAIALTAASGPTDVTNQSGNYTADKRQKPLWQAAGLTSDPGGFFDITGTLAAAITTGTGTMGLTVTYTD